MTKARIIDIIGTIILWAVLATLMAIPFKVLTSQADAEPIPTIAEGMAQLDKLKPAPKLASLSLGGEDSPIDFSDSKDYAEKVELGSKYVIDTRTKTSSQTLER